MFWVPDSEQSYAGDIEPSAPPKKSGPYRRPNLALLLLVGACLGGAAGYLLARAFPTSHGVVHSCPGGAPASDCFYPANQTSHQVLLAVAGSLVVALIAVLVWSALSDRRP